MSVNNFIATVWSKKIQDDMEAKCKLVDNCLSDYEGDCVYARSVKILGVGEPTIRQYVPGEDIVIEAPNDTAHVLTVDQANYFGVFLDDVDKAQAVPGLMEKYLEKSVHGLAVKRDEYVAQLIKAATHVTTAQALTQEAVKDAVDTAIVALRERNFDEEGVIEITPAVYSVFKNCLITLSTDNPGYIQRGIVGRYDDFDVVMCNTLARDDSHAYCAVRGRKAIAFAGQINVVESYRDPNSFKEVVRGLDTFGAKTIDDDRIQVIKVPVA